MALTQPIRSKKQIMDMTYYYLYRGKTRNYVLIVLLLYTALRISDILRLTWDQVYDFDKRRVRKSITIMEMKTKKTKVIALNKAVVNALTQLAATKAEKGHSIIENTRTGEAIRRFQAYRVIHDAGEAVGIPERVSCHSLRKTFGYHAWKSGVSPAVIMEIYNHSSLAVTRRYLGVTQDDTNAVYLGLNYNAD